MTNFVKTDGIDCWMREVGYHLLFTNDQVAIGCLEPTAPAACSEFYLYFLVFYKKNLRGNLI